MRMLHVHMRSGQQLSMISGAEPGSRDGSESSSYDDESSSDESLTATEIEDDLEPA